MWCIVTLKKVTGNAGAAVPEQMPLHVSTLLTRKANRHGLSTDAAVTSTCYAKMNIHNLKRLVESNVFQLLRKY